MRIIGCLCAAALSCSALSIEEKVGQVLMVHFNGEKVNEDARTLVKDLKVGGIIYYRWANGLTSQSQVKELSSELQKMAKIPLLIATDQEGGRVTRLQEGFTKLPSSLELAKRGDVEESCYKMGTEMLSAGINMNLAPVVDINSNPKNPVIGDRSFGRDVDIVIQSARKALNGYEKAGVITTLKHFPGHGDVEVDSHVALPIVKKSLDALKALELCPFKELRAPVIMTAHILVPALDSKYPTTVSKKTLDYLREKLGFEGVIISDSLIMGALLDRYESIEDASIEAFNAGCDILLLGGKLLNGSHAGFELTTDDIKRVHAAMVAAVKSDRIAKERLDSAVSRILKLKEGLSR
jgi:beta-N-acetylhexosaminidase